MLIWRIGAWWNLLAGKWWRFRELTPPQQGLFLRSLVLLPLAAGLVRIRGLGWVQQWTLARRPPPIAIDNQQINLAREAAEAVDLAARRGPWRANCLQRSVVLWRELVRLSVSGDLRIGVRSGGAEPEMHAWVEVADVVINDAPDVGERFRPFDKPILPPRARFD